MFFCFYDAINLRSNGKISKTRRNKFETVIKAAGLVLASNSYLAESASILGAKVEISPTSVNVDRYLSQIPKLEKIILVWIGSRSTSRYLESHRDILEALGEKIPGIRLGVILYMAAGLPVVSSVVGANREVIEMGRYNLRFEPKSRDNLLFCFTSQIVLCRQLIDTIIQQ